MARSEHPSLYGEVTQRIIAELEQGRLPWVQPWDAPLCPCTMPKNALSEKSYPGINVLILWAAASELGYSSQRWLTYRQATKTGGHVRRGEKGTVIYYADRFTPRDDAAKASSEDRDARTIAFLKRFTVFHTSVEMTGHGFRAMASTLLNESGKWHTDAIERALAHRDSDKVRAAYRSFRRHPKK